MRYVFHSADFMARLPEKLLTFDPAYLVVEECPQSGFRGWDVLFLNEGEGDCKCEIVSGQFSIFGAIEEILCRGLRG